MTRKFIIMVGCIPCLMNIMEKINNNNNNININIYQLKSEVKCLWLSINKLNEQLVHKILSNYTSVYTREREREKLRGTYVEVKKYGRRSFAQI